MLRETKLVTDAALAQTEDRAAAQQARAEAQARALEAQLHGEQAGAAFVILGPWKNFSGRANGGQRIFQLVRHIGRETLDRVQPVI